MEVHTRVALLGVTHPHSSGRLKALLRSPGVTVVGAADETAISDAFRDHFELRRLQVDEVLRDKEIDAALIHSGSAQMADLAAAALRAGKSVLVEKPGGQNVADVRRIVDAEKASPGVCQVGYTTIASQGIARGREILDSGALGRVLQVRVHGSCAEGEASSDFLNAPGEMGGPLWIIGSHAMHPCGAARRPSCQLRRPSRRHLCRDRQALVLYPSGAST